MTDIHPLRLRAFIAQVDTTGGIDACWPWQGFIDDDGYGLFHGVGAHRVACELMNRPIPTGLIVDHRCHNVDTTCPGGVTCRHRRCVNPAHLDVVTRGENVLRSQHTMPHQNAAKTHCPNGHGYTAENTYSRQRAGGVARRECRECRRERSRIEARASRAGARRTQSAA
ncbi:HNH endonuclease signature motif containing protein [Micromonospora tarensis]|uniref:HNH endonuclease n=1 Tax=Micromonospora tarensis TaxID=2806100 RepID=A0ABS1YIN0_9ACTN|nr:HNH endonuclease signature motif containing protein [Micromonospora tarensis]MBM0277227.1 HNH endonuclease [Micromonospora tarensis]